MNELGSELRRIREDCSLTLKEVVVELKPTISITTDFLSKVEKGERNPSPQLIEGLSRVYELPSLIEFYYHYRIRNELGTLLSQHPNPTKLLRKVLKEWENPLVFNQTSPKSKWGLNGLSHVSRYVKGGRRGKVKGYDFYLTKNDTLQPKHRKILLEESQLWMMNIPSVSIQSPLKGDGELDGSLTDLEIVDSWNEFYDQWGHSIPKFREKWNREFLPSDETQKKHHRNSLKVEEESKMDEVNSFLKRKSNPDVRYLG